MAACVSQRTRVEVDHEMKDNNAYQKAGEKLKRKCKDVESECGKLEWPFRHTRLMWAGWAILEICQRIISLVLRAVRVTRKERTTIPNDRI